MLAPEQELPVSHNLILAEIHAQLQRGALDKASEMIQNNPDATGIKEAIAWERYLRAEALSAQAATHPHAAIALAQVQRELHRFPESAKTLRELASAGHSTHETHRRAAVMHRSHGAHKEALRQAQAGLALDPHFGPLLNLSAELSALRKAPEASSAILSALEAGAIRPADAIKHLLMAGSFEVAESLVGKQPDIANGGPTPSWRARFALWRRDTETATRIGQQLIAMHPGHPEGHFLLGASAQLNGQSSEAIGHLDAALQQTQPIREGGWLNATAAWTFKAEALLALGHAEQALKAADSAMTVAKEYNPAAHGVRMLAVLEAQQNKNSKLPPRLMEVAHHLSALMDAPEALDDGQKSTFQIQVRSALHRLGGNRSNRLSYLNNQGKLHPFAPPPYPRSMGRVLQQQIRILPPEQILSGFEELKAAHPGDPTVHTYAGELRLWLGQYDTAIACFDKALSLDKKTVWAWIGLGAAHLMNGRPRRARWTFYRGIRMVGFEGPTVFVYRGEAHRVLGNKTRALADLTHATQANPKRVSAWINLALAHPSEHPMSGTLATAIRQTNPSIWWDAALAAGLDPMDKEAVRPILQSCLGLMRGNRSSANPTYISPEGSLRCMRWHAEDVPVTLG
jgi:tetratricopeptide (TPR) repeat protein